MKIVKSEQTSFWDVDHTLILPIDGKEPKDGLKIDIYDVITKRYIKMVAHEPMVRLLREEHHRGGFIIVWSRGGYEWAANVLKALEITDCVELVMSKPMAYFDDVPIDKWLPYRVYLEPGTKYK